MTPPELSAILVHYHAAALAAQAVDRLQAELAGAPGGAEILVVDNGSDAAGRAVLERLPVRLLDPGGNRGYAGGLNLGIEAARGRMLLLMNPDVMVLPGCVRALRGAVEAGAAAAGPRFWWDSEKRLLLPPTEERSRRAALLERLAPAAAPLVARARRRWRRHARRHWLAAEPFASVSLSGALLAVRREAWERAGPFDEGYTLYFEETDWLLRLARAGLRTCCVPAAEAVHLYDQSAAGEPRSGAWFAASRRRFERRHYGVVPTALLGAAEDLARRAAGAPGDGAGRPGPAPGAGESPPEVELALPPGAIPPLWVEVSPSPRGFPAAAERLPTPASGAVAWSLPREVWARLRPGAYHLRVTDARGREGPAALLVRG
ncbi:MAG TPA: glycosyltransferase [Thermoanaerobaculia bacterium]